jgi:predicted Zn-dependent protease
MKSIIILLSIIFSLYSCELDFSKNKSVQKSEVIVEIVGLNDYCEEDLEIIKSTLENFYGFECKISEPVSLNLSSCETAQYELGQKDYFDYVEGEKIVIYATNQDLYDPLGASTTSNNSVQGLCYGNQIYLKSNIVYDRQSSIDLIKVNAIHEVAHSFGLQHCKNTCIMNNESFEYWDSQNDKPIFCSDCKSKLP